MRLMTIKVSEKYYQMCYDLYYRTEAKDKYSWEEFLGMTCTYGIAVVWNFYMQVQCKTIYDVEKAWELEFSPKEVMEYDKITAQNRKRNSNAKGVQ